MSSQEFFYLYAIIIVIFALWYQSTRKKQKQQPVQLNLRASDSRPVVLPPEAPEVKENSHYEVEKAAEFYKLRYSQKGIPIAPTRKNSVKELNAIFAYNGHTWDAYEVLAVPAGSPLPLVTTAYQSAIKKSDRDSHMFLETAYKTILTKLSHGSN